VDLEDIGIIECRATVDADTEYFSGEAEFRVREGQIREIKPSHEEIRGLAFAQEKLTQRNQLTGELSLSKL
jgi:hypothetical protein